MKKFATIAFALMLTVAVSAQMKINFGADSPLRKLQIAEMAINNMYVEKVDENKLVEDGIRGMIEKLDPHSAYATAKEVKEMNEPLEGSFEGIGVQFNMFDDTLLVIQPVSNGPSEKVGIVAGDRIVTVNDTAIAGVKMSKENIMKRLRGPKSSKVKLGIIRRGVNGILTFTVTRDKIPVHTVDASYIISPGTGYIRLSSFGATTHDEFLTCVAQLKKQGMKDLILDLQDNGGGYLNAAVDIANEFLEKGDLIVYTEGRNMDRRDYNAEGNGKLQNGKVIVLVDEYTASASEIVSGAIQDQDRGKVVGRRTFGKGLVQRPIPLPDGSMIRLTIAHYYAPSGRCIQKPYVKGKGEDYALDVLNRLKHGELTNKDSIHFADSLKFFTLKKHNVVYGGGGIMPDYFIPLDTTVFTKYHRSLTAQNIITNCDLEYIDAHRNELKKEYPTFEAFNKKYQVPQSLIDQVIKEGEKKKIKPTDDAELKRTMPYLCTQLKALVARDLWDMSEYFQIMNESNEIVKKAVELLKK
jgi:carboxyl-terminal processing protease